MSVLGTIIFLNFRTDRSGQTVQTRSDCSDQGLHCLPFCLHRLDSEPHSSNRVITTNFFGSRNI